MSDKLINVEETQITDPVTGVGDNVDTNIDPEFGVFEEDMDPEFGVIHDSTPDIPYIIMAKYDTEFMVTDIYTSCFNTVDETDLKIAEGFGSEYAHATMYSVLDENFLYNYKVIEENVVGEDGSTTKVKKMVERTPEEKRLELEQNVYSDAPSIHELGKDVASLFAGVVDVDTKVTSVQEDTVALFDGVIEADNKATAAQTDATALFDGVIEADSKAVSAQSDTAALFEGLVDVDERLVKLQASSTSNTSEIAKINEAINAINVKLNKVIEHLKITV